MKLTKWSEQVQERLKWKDIVEKVKTLPEEEEDEEDEEEKKKKNVITQFAKLAAGEQFVSSLHSKKIIARQNL
jgi:hypothetical protein